MGKVVQFFIFRCPSASKRASDIDLIQGRSSRYWQDLWLDLNLMTELLWRSSMRDREEFVRPMTWERMGYYLTGDYAAEAKSVRGRELGEV